MNVEAARHVLPGSVGQAQKIGCQSANYISGGKTGLVVPPGIPDLEAFDNGTNMVRPGPAGQFSAQ
ncbi:hypothetical protein HED63_27675 [Ochrobactrum cytisi]|nr:hypothetical protein [Brucella cytisi]